MILASCCGPFDDASPDLLKTWAIAALVCGVLLLVDAVVLAWIRWREGERLAPTYRAGRAGGGRCHIRARTTCLDRLPHCSIHAQDR